MCILASPRSTLQIFSYKYVSSRGVSDMLKDSVPCDACEWGFADARRLGVSPHESESPSSQPRPRKGIITAHGMRAERQEIRNESQ
jgi:hypothetical protein